MFRLLRYFTITSAIILAITVAVLVQLYRSDHLSEHMSMAEEESVRLATSFANSLWPEFAPFFAEAPNLDVEGLRQRPELRLIDIALQSMAAGLPIVKLKIYSATGLTLYSPDRKEIGEDRQDNPFILAVRSEGRAKSNATFRKTFQAFNGIIKKRHIVETYYPVRDSAQNLIGVLEIYSDITSSTTRSEMKTVWLAGLLVVAFISLFGTLFLIVRRADSIIRTQYLELEQNHAELERKVNQLETSRKELKYRAVALEVLTEKQSELNKRLKYEVVVKDRFFSIISHDLISPFNSLLGMTQMMVLSADAFSKEKFVDYARDINGTAESVFDLMKNLLEWSQLQVKPGQVSAEVIDIEGLVDQCIGVLEPVALNKAVRLTNEVKNISAFGDSNMIQTVLRNLIANSVKFSWSGGAVEVSSEMVGKMVQVTVMDAGIGMSKSQIRKIFVLDEKTSTFGTAGERGTGLGLPLCKNMVELNGGHIWVESQSGEGARFHFTIPAKPRGERLPG